MISDWTVSIASFVSLAISLITLYLAHLRGPDIKLTIQGKIFPCKGFSYNGLDDSFTIDTRFLVANTGNRSGILFDFRLDPANDSVRSYRLDPRPENELPLPLLAGEGWATSAHIGVKPRIGSWDNFLPRIDTLQMRAMLVTSASFGRVIHRYVKLNIDLKPMKDSAPEILGKKSGLGS